MFHGTPAGFSPTRSKNLDLDQLQGAPARLVLLCDVLGSVDLLELIPVQPPIEVPHQVSLEDALIVALHHRPEIDQVTHEIRAASVRLDVSKNEILPVLNPFSSSIRRTALNR